MDFSLSEIASVIDAAKGQGYFENQLESSFAPLYDKLNSISKDTQKLTVTDLIPIDQNKFKNFKQRYEQSLEKFIDSFEDKVNLGSVKELKENPKKEEVKQKGIIDKILYSVANSGKVDRKNGFKTEVDEDPKEVIIKGASKSYFEKMQGLFPNLTAVFNDRQDEDKNKGSILGKIGKFLAIAGLGVAAFATGAVLLFEAFMTDGKFKGTLAVIGRSLVKPVLAIFDGMLKDVVPRILDIGLKPLKGLFSLGTKLIPFKKIGGALSRAAGFGIFKTIGKFAGKGLKLAFRGIPILGSLISLAFAVQRFKRGDTLGGVLELVAAIPFPPLSLAVGVFLAARDLTTTPQQRQSQGSTVFKGITDWFMKNKFFGGVLKFFKGVYGFFTAKSGEDIDKSLDMIKEGSGPLFKIVFPIYGLITFLRSKTFADISTKVKGRLGVAWDWIAKRFGDLVDNIRMYVSNLWGNFKKSNTFQILKNKFEIAKLTLTKTIITTFDSVIGIVQWLAGKMIGIIDHKIVKTIIGKIDGATGRNDLQKINNVIDQVNSFATTNLNQVADSLDKQIKLKQEDSRKRRKLEEERQKMQEAREKMLHTESLENQTQNANNIVEAINKQNGVIMASAGGQEGGGNTSISNNVNNSPDSKRKPRRQVYELNYMVPSY